LSLLARLWWACPPLVGLPAFGGLARLWWACPPLVGLPAFGGLARRSPDLSGRRRVLAFLFPKQSAMLFLNIFGRGMGGAGKLMRFLFPNNCRAIALALIPLIQLLIPDP